MRLERAELFMEFRKPGENIAAVPLLWKKRRRASNSSASTRLPSFTSAVVGSLPRRLQSQAQVLCLLHGYFCYISADSINTGLSL